MEAGQQKGAIVDREMAQGMEYGCDDIDGEDKNVLGAQRVKQPFRYGGI